MSVVRWGPSGRPHATGSSPWVGGRCSPSTSVVRVRCALGCRQWAGGSRDSPLLKEGERLRFPRQDHVGRMRPLLTDQELKSLALITHISEVSGNTPTTNYVILATDTRVWQEGKSPPPPSPQLCAQASGLPEPMIAVSTGAEALATPLWCHTAHGVLPRGGG